MGDTFEKMINLFILFALFCLSVWVIAGSTLTGLTHRQVSDTASAIDDINNTISSYIQKNGGYFNDPTLRNDFETALLEAHGLEKMSSTCERHCVDINVEPQQNTLVTSGGAGKESQRGTKYDITTNYRHFTSYFSLTGFKQGWSQARPRHTVSYVHQYINDGNMTK